VFAEAMSVIVPNFGMIGQTVTELWWFFDFFQYGGSPAFWICCMCLEHSRRVFSGLYCCV